MSDHPHDEPLVYITPNLAVPRSRAVEWYQGIRPLPGHDADFFFQESVRCGLMTRETALELLRRHERLNRQEAAMASGGLVCKTCHGDPPPGFQCRSCGAEVDA